MTSHPEKIRVGIVGMGRAASFIKPIMTHPHAMLAAVADRIPGKAAIQLEAQRAFPADVHVYLEYEDMLANENLDVVIIGSGWSDHVSQSIRALEKNIHVYSEVPAASTLEDARALAIACRKSKAQYMMGENSCYHRHLMIVHNMIRDGLLGYLHYAEGEYIHDCRYLLEQIPWREREQFSVNGLLYMTHDLGPILGWMDWDRVVRVSAAGSGSHFQDSQGNPFVMETRLTLQAKTARGRLIRLCQDFQSPCAGYHHRYIAQGVDGRYESRYRGFPDQIMSTRLPDTTGKPAWQTLNPYEVKYLPDLWRRLEAEALRHGHGGSDYIIMHDFLDAIWQGREVPLDIWKSLDMTLPGILSVTSLSRQDAWVEVPDPRKW